MYVNFGGNVTQTLESFCRQIRFEFFVDDSCGDELVRELVSVEVLLLPSGIDFTDDIVFRGDADGDAATIGAKFRTSSTIACTTFGCAVVVSGVGAGAVDGAKAVGGAGAVGGESVVGGTDGDVAPGDTTSASGTDGKGDVGDAAGSPFTFFYFFLNKILSNVYG